MIQRPFWIFPSHIMMVCFCHHIFAKLSHLLQYLTINRMTNLAFGVLFEFSLPPHLAHVEEMAILWIVTQKVSLDISRKIQLSLFFSRLNFIAPGLSRSVVSLMLFQLKLLCRLQTEAS